MTSGWLKRRWYVWVPLEDDSPETLEAAKAIAESRLLRSVQTRQYQFDMDNPLAIYATHQDQVQFVAWPMMVLAEMGVLMTRRQDIERKLEVALARIIQIDDELVRVDESQLQTREAELVDSQEGLIYERARLERSIKEWREVLGWV